ncbi:PTS sugar transporter subunit IIB [Photobacterium sp. DNB23_23_1]
MKKIYLFCAAGMSTSLLVNKMKRHAKEHNVPVEIAAYSESTITEKGREADVILLAPQIRYMKNDFSNLYPDTPVVIIDSLVYGTLDGLSLLKTAIKEIKQKNKAISHI